MAIVKILKLFPELEALLKEHGLADFDVLMSGDVGEKFDAYEAAATRRIKMGGRVFFLKRRASSPLSVSLELYALWSRAHSAPYREMLHSENIRAAGIPVMQEVAAGEERCFGFPRVGFILTLGVPGESLQTALPKMEAERRKVVVRALGELVGDLHGAGFFNSLRLKDVIFDWPEGGPAPRLSLIDREVRTTGARHYRRARALRALDRATARAARNGRIMTDQEWGELLGAYAARLGERAPMSAEGLAHRYAGRSF